MQNEYSTRGLLFDSYRVENIFILVVLLATTFFYFSAPLVTFLPENISVIFVFLFDEDSH